MCTNASSQDKSQDIQKQNTLNKIDVKNGVWNSKLWQKIKLKKHRQMIGFMLQKYPENFAFRLFTILQ